MTIATDPINDFILQILAGVASKAAQRHAAIRDEIKDKGTWWAATEIDRLRQDARRLRAERKAP